jgi:hypothetical protein
MRSKYLAIGVISALTTLSIGGCGGGGGGGGDSSASTQDPNALFAKNLLLDNFVKGNTHAHTLRSWDSDATKAPNEDVINWYRNNGYNFLAITDHDLEFQPALYNHLQTQDFILIAGEEVSSTWIDPELIDPVNGHDGSIFVHVTALCTDEVPIMGRHFQLPDTVETALGDAVARINAVPGTVPIISHPNLDRAIHVSDMLNVAGVKLFEVANQDEDARNMGYVRNGIEYPSTDEMWDEILSAGREMYGLAADDAHDFRDPASAPADNPVLFPPGGGWVQVALPSSDTLSAANVCSALNSGMFYSSTGIELSRIEVAGNRMNINIVSQGGASGEYMTEFHGLNGEILDTVFGLSPSYTLSGDEVYVRAVVSGPAEAGADLEDNAAWVQPVFLQ